ncbi:hypothetical protein FHU35_14111 [Saccharopolyspora dendranthemae]|uniref:Uncharacterized protein n=1 Tax=Saccharopolyspora dendranthemae TaxID=1181886 RepID=A0A561U398_9PSEU|nr:hypothetical protein FHU35_14111 [Saccharopolyspora dendranthemae]
MRSRSDVAGLQRVEDEYGTGDVVPIDSQLLGFGGFRFTGRHYDSDTKGSTLAIAETEPILGRPSDELLDGAASVAVLFSPP